MRAGGPGPDDSIGEWHMHCHVLAHMMIGMMGSLLIVKGGELALALPVGVPCDMPGMGGNGQPPSPTTKEVDAVDDAANPTGFSFSPQTLTVNKNDTVLFKNISSDLHSVIWDTPGAPTNTPNFGSGGGIVSRVMSNAGTFNYHCGIHGSLMKGSNLQQRTKQINYYPGKENIIWQYVNALRQ